MKRSIATVALGATIAAAGLSTAAASQPRMYTDEQIVRGLIFGQGELAHEIDTEVRLPDSLTAVDRKNYERFTDHIVDDVLHNTSYETAEALDKVQSGDPYEVLDGFSGLRDAFSSSLRSNYPEAIEAGARDDSARVCGPTVCAAALVLAIAVGTVIAGVNFNVAGNVNIVVNQNGLWTNNGVWNSRMTTTSTEGLPTADPSKVAEHYPHLRETEVAARLAALFA